MIIGNGDVLSYADAIEKHKTYGVDGIMIGRGIFQNLWIFNKDVDPLSVPIETKLKLLIEHIELFDATRGKTKPLEILKKFYKVYVSGLPNAAEIRINLMDCKTKEETIAESKPEAKILETEKPVETKEEVTAVKESKKEDTSTDSEEAK